MQWKLNKLRKMQNKLSTYKFDLLIGFCTLNIFLWSLKQKQNTKYKILA